jgi:hypothetical protein
VVEGHVTGLLEQRRDVETGLPDRGRNLGQRQLAIGVVQDIVRHGNLLMGA